ncbi:MAG: ABC transporter ATP-binding protein [Lachnospiraceae bacterium]|jgi:multidrug/hemolysin transport system ATP-binding protein|nr:ABC transporter ATP-binding protein [Lachnospiraceae bacterium]
MSKVIEVKGLKKRYGATEAVKGITFDVDKGSLFAFLGVNGAGKSTTINILSTLMRQDEGQVIINGNSLGKEDKKIRNEIGVVFQNGVLDELLTIKENLSVRGSFYGYSGSELEERINKASEITGCSDILHKKYGKLSGGQKRRADIARALINQPHILFLDEPTTGLDPKTRQSIWQTIATMQKKNSMTVFLTTHYMEEAANADKITILKKGEIILEGTPNKLKEKYTTDILSIYHPSEEVLTYLKQKKIEFKNILEGIEMNISEPIEAIRILKYMEEIQRVSPFEMKHGTIDDVFLNIMEE